LLACVASVFVGLSSGLKHFSLLGRAKIGASTKKFIGVALAPIFAPPKSEKCLERVEEPTETLATLTRICSLVPCQLSLNELRSFRLEDDSPGIKFDSPRLLSLTLPINSSQVTLNHLQNKLYLFADSFMILILGAMTTALGESLPGELTNYRLNKAAYFKEEEDGIPANLIKSEIGTTLPPPSPQSWGSALPPGTEQGPGCSRVFALIFKNIACTVLF